MACIFCDILAGRRPAHVLWEDGSHLAFLDRYPIDLGHALVIPKAHHERITGMGPADVGSLFSRVPAIAAAVLGATGADGFSLGQNNGRSARQIVPHVHVHIIPRNSRTGAAWTKRRIPEDSELAGLAASIRRRLARSGPGCT